MTRVTIQRTSGWIKFVWLVGMIFIWFFFPVMLIAGAGEKSFTILCLGIIITHLSKLFRWMYNE